jgi:hypothetical protein
VSPWDIATNALVLGGGLTAFAGSCAQAWGDLHKYQDLYLEFKVNARPGLGSFLSKRDLGWSGQFKQIALLPRVAISASKQVSGAEHDKVEQALNDAAGWSLILFGSFLAIGAGLIPLFRLVPW